MLEKFEGSRYDVPLSANEDENFSSLSSEISSSGEIEAAAAVDPGVAEALGAYFSGRVYPKFTALCERNSKEGSGKCLAALRYFKYVAAVFASVKSFSRRSHLASFTPSPAEFASVSGYFDSLAGREAVIEEGGLELFLERCRRLDSLCAESEALEIARAAEKRAREEAEERAARQREIDAAAEAARKREAAAAEAARRIEAETAREKKAAEEYQARLERERMLADETRRRDELRVGKAVRPSRLPGEVKWDAAESEGGSLGFSAAVIGGFIGMFFFSGAGLVAGALIGYLVGKAGSGPKLGDYHLHDDGRGYEVAGGAGKETGGEAGKTRKETDRRGAADERYAKPLAVEGRGNAGCVFSVAGLVAGAIMGDSAGAVAGMAMGFLTGALVDDINTGKGWKDISGGAQLNIVAYVTLIGAYSGFGKLLSFVAGAFLASLASPMLEAMYSGGGPPAAKRAKDAMADNASSGSGSEREDAAGFAEAAAPPSGDSVNMAPAGEGSSFGGKRGRGRKSREKRSRKAERDGEDESEGELFEGPAAPVTEVRAPKKRRSGGGRTGAVSSPSSVGLSDTESRVAVFCVIAGVFIGGYLSDDGRNVHYWPVFMGGIVGVVVAEILVTAARGTSGGVTPAGNGARLAPPEKNDKD